MIFLDCGEADGTVHLPELTPGWDDDVSAAASALFLPFVLVVVSQTNKPQAVQFESKLRLLLRLLG